MTNHLVGDVYAKIIEEVINASSNDFEESGVGQQTLQELQSTWQQKLSALNVAQMPWDPKPQPVQQPLPSTLPSNSANTNGATQSGYPAPPANPTTNGNARVKAEPGTEQRYHLPQANGYQQQGMNTQLAQQRAASLLQEQFGNQANASLSAMQRSGLALPGQQQQKPHGLQLPPQNQQHLQQQYAQQQHQAMQRQQQQLQQQQHNPRIKVENDSPRTDNGQFQQQPRQAKPAYSQTDGADGALEDWQAYMAQRRAITSEETQTADRMMRDQVSQLASTLESGLMMPLDEQKRLPAKRRRVLGAVPIQSTPSSGVQASVSTTGPAIPQLDGDHDDEDQKLDIKDEEADEDAINSDLDDSDDDQGRAGEEDDDLGDSILCTYDKVQRVKNKWKCTLKDGVLNTGDKEYLFHKAQGEFEW